MKTFVNEEFEVRILKTDDGVFEKNDWFDARYESMTKATRVGTMLVNNGVCKEARIYKHRISQEWTVQGKRIK